MLALLVCMSTPPPARAVTSVVFSSGFLCFSNHLGVLRALEEHDAARNVRSIVGTSSGSIVGAMFAAGLSADEITDVFRAQRPISLCRPSLKPWRGMFTSDALCARLAGVLPTTFADLKVPLAVGTVTKGAKETVLITEGSLLDAIAASCAVPRMFVPIVRDGHVLVDGGIVDRTMLGPSAAFRAQHAGAYASTLVHLVSDVDGTAFGPRDGVPLEMVDEHGELRPPSVLVRTPRTKQGLHRRFRGRFDGEVAQAQARTAAVLDRLRSADGI